MKKIDQINEKLTKGREKLEEIKKRYKFNSKKITELVQKRAVLLADEALESDPKRKEEIKNLSGQIDDLKKVTESQGPELISALEKKLQGIQTEKNEEELILSFEKQKKLGAKIVELSGNLIESLKQANSTNGELNKVWPEYANLAKITKKSGMKAGSKTTMGSQGSLSALLGTLHYEWKEGKPRPSSEFSRMRI
ncbi:hypothetical protein ES708_15119 [subsurface metagenome]